jgi:hypothetical protein
MSIQRDAVQKLHHQLNLIEELKAYNPYSDAFRQWHLDTEALIARIWGDDKQLQATFREIMYTPLFLSCRGGDAVFDEAYREGLQAAQRLLDSLIRRLSDQAEA